MRYNTGYAAYGISGDPSPSEADLRLTRRIVEASKILQLQLIDHVIIGSPAPSKNSYFSFKEEESFPDAPLLNTAGRAALSCTRSTLEISSSCTLALLAVESTMNLDAV